jgi:hypothetical protein
LSIITETNGTPEVKHPTRIPSAKRLAVLWGPFLIGNVSVNSLGGFAYINRIPLGLPR